MDRFTITTQDSKPRHIFIRRAVYGAAFVAASMSAAIGSAVAFEHEPASAFFAGTQGQAVTVTNKRQSKRAVAYAPPPTGSLQSLVTAYARQHGVPVAIAHAVIRAESGYRCNARSSAGAVGIAQVKPATARSVGVHGSLYDCRNSLDAGMRYLRLALNRGGHGCAGVSLYERGIYARPACTGYGRKVMRLASIGGMS